jgi:subtilase family serine protease
MRTASSIGIVLGAAIVLATPSGHAQQARAMPPDLVCTARAKIGSVYIQNGASVNATNFYAEILGSNKSYGKADKVTGQVEVFKNGSSFKGIASWGTKTLAPGASQVLAMVPVSMPSFEKGSYQFGVKGVVDAKNQVAETNENNNQCWLTFTLNVK